MRLSFLNFSLILILAILICSCSATVRLTKETIVPGNPPQIVIEWQKGTKLSDVRTVQIGEYIETVSPVISEEGVK